MRRGRLARGECSRVPLFPVVVSLAVVVLLVVVLSVGGCSAVLCTVRGAVTVQHVIPSSIITCTVLRLHAVTRSHNSQLFEYSTRMRSRSIVGSTMIHNDICLPIE